MNKLSSFINKYSLIIKLFLLIILAGTFFLNIFEDDGLKTSTLDQVLLAINHFKGTFKDPWINLRVSYSVVFFIVFTVYGFLLFNRKTCKFSCIPLAILLLYWLSILISINAPRQSNYYAALSYAFYIILSIVIIQNLYYIANLVSKRYKAKPPKPKKLSSKERIAQLEQEVEILKNQEKKTGL